VPVIADNHCPVTQSTVAASPAGVTADHNHAQHARLLLDGYWILDTIHITITKIISYKSMMGSRIAVLTFAVLVCRRSDLTFSRRFALSLF